QREELTLADIEVEPSHCERFAVALGDLLQDNTRHGSPRRLSSANAAGRSSAYGAIPLVVPAVDVHALVVDAQHAVNVGLVDVVEGHEQRIFGAQALPGLRIGGPDAGILREPELELLVEIGVDEL